VSTGEIAITAAPAGGIDGDPYQPNLKIGCHFIAMIVLIGPATVNSAVAFFRPEGYTARNAGVSITRRLELE